VSLDPNITRAALVLMVAATLACGDGPSSTEAAYVPLPRELWGQAEPGDWARYRVERSGHAREMVIRVVDHDLNRVAYEVYRPGPPAVLERAEEVIPYPGPEVEERLLETVVDYGRETIRVGGVSYDALRVARRNGSETVTEWFAMSVRAGGLVMRREDGEVTRLIAHGGASSETL